MEIDSVFFLLNLSTTWFLLNSTIIRLICSLSKIFQPMWRTCNRRREARKRKRVDHVPLFSLKFEHEMIAEILKCIWDCMLRYVVCDPSFVWSSRSRDQTSISIPHQGLFFTCSFHLLLRFLLLHAHFERTLLLSWSFWSVRAKVSAKPSQKKKTQNPEFMCDDVKAFIEQNCESPWGTNSFQMTREILTDKFGQWYLHLNDLRDNVPCAGVVEYDMH